MGFKTFADMQILNAADVNDFLMRQTVMRFANAAERNAQLPAPQAGDVVLLLDTGIVWQRVIVSGTGYWAPLPGTVVFHAVCSSSSTSIDPATYVALPWAAPVVDVFGGFAAGAVSYTPPVPGVYKLEGGGSFTTNTTGDYRSIAWHVDGVAVTGGGAAYLHPAINRFAVYPARSTAVRLNGANAVSLRLQHNASAALTLGGGANIPTMTVTYAGP